MSRVCRGPIMFFEWRKTWVCKDPCGFMNWQTFAIPCESVRTHGVVCEQTNLHHTLWFCRAPWCFKHIRTVICEFIDWSEQVLVETRGHSNYKFINFYISSLKTDRVRRQKPKDLCTSGPRVGESKMEPKSSQASENNLCIHSMNNLCIHNMSTITLYNKTLISSLPMQCSVCLFPPFYVSKANLILTMQYSNCYLQDDFRARTVRVAG